MLIMCILAVFAACQKIIEERLGIKNSPIHKKDKRKKSKDTDISKNPFEKLKGLFRKKHNDVKHDDNPREIKTLPVTESSSLEVPRLILNEHEENGKENTGKRKKSKKHSKVRSLYYMYSLVLFLYKNIHIKQIFILKQNTIYLLK